MEGGHIHQIVIILMAIWPADRPMTALNMSLPMASYFFTFNTRSLGRGQIPHITVILISAMGEKVLVFEIINYYPNFPPIFKTFASREFIR